MKCALFIDRRGGLLKCSKKWPIDCFDIEKKKIFFLLLLQVSVGSNPVGRFKE